MRRRRPAKAGKAPRTLYTYAHHFSDHAGGNYTAVHTATSPHATPPKLGVQVYHLGDPKSTTAVAEGLLCCDAIRAFDREARCDVYIGFETIEACIEHHRREKTFRADAIKNMRREAVAGLSGDDAHEKLIDEIRGRQPLPHIVPTWCSSVKFWNEGQSGDRYRSWIIVIPEDRRSWEDVVDKGLLYVEFDRDITQEMLVLIHDCNPEDDMVLEGEVDGYVDIEKTSYDKCPPVRTRLLCVREMPPEVRYPRWEDNFHVPEDVLHGWKTPNSEGRLLEVWHRVASIFRDCSYRNASCDECRMGEEHENCERELDEHFLDEDGQCVACRRAREYRRRSKRIAARTS